MDTTRNPSRGPFRVGPRGPRLPGIGRGICPGLPQFSRSSGGGQPEHLLIPLIKVTRFLLIKVTRFSRASASLPAPGIPGGRPRRQAAVGYSPPTQSETRPSGFFPPGLVEAAGIEPASPGRPVWALAGSGRVAPSAPLGWYGSACQRPVQGVSGALRAMGYPCIPSGRICKYCLTFQISRQTPSDALCRVLGFPYTKALVPSRSCDTGHPRWGVFPCVFNDLCAV